MKVVLTVQSGLHSGRRISILSGQTITVGRTDAAEFAIPEDPTLSRIHFSISSDLEGCKVSDLGSTSGTSVNGQPCTARTLSDGDEILAGQTSFRVQISSLKSLSRPEFGPGVRTEESIPKTSSHSSIKTAYSRGMSEESPVIRQYALFAAAKAGVPTLLSHCRRSVDQEVDVFVRAEAMMVAVLGDGQDLNRVRKVTARQDWGLSRFSVAGAFGHPGLIPDLLETICRSECQKQRVGAAIAFTRITGIEIDNGEPVSLDDENAEADSFESAFVDEAASPDADLAVTQWNQQSERFLNAERWYRGINLNDSIEDIDFGRLDLEACQQILLREAYWGTPNKVLYERLSSFVSNQFLIQ